MAITSSTRSNGESNIDFKPYEFRVRLTIVRNPSAGRPCESRDPYPRRHDLEKASAPTRLADRPAACDERNCARAGVPAFAGTTHVALPAIVSHRKHECAGERTKFKSAE